MSDIQWLFPWPFYSLSLSLSLSVAVALACFCHKWAQSVSSVLCGEHCKNMAAIKANCTASVMFYTRCKLLMLFINQLFFLIFKIMRETEMYGQNAKNAGKS